MATLTVRNETGKEFQVDEQKIGDAERDGFLPVVSNGKQNHRVAYKDLQVAQKDGYRPFNVDNYKPENIENTKAKSAEEASGLGSFLVDKVLSPVATFLDYPQAPIRQALAAPAKALSGDPVGAVTDVVTQLGKSPREAPTSAQVLEMYGVPKEKKVSAFAVSNPLMATTYENDPMEDDTENVTIQPSTAGGVLLDTATGSLAFDGLGKPLKPLVNSKLATTSGEKIKDFAGSVKNKFSANQTQSAEAVAEGGAKSSAYISGGDLSIEQKGELFKFKAPKSLDELKNWKPKPGQGALVGKKRLEEIAQSVPDLETPPLKYHFEMMENPKSMKELKLKFENLPTDDAKRIAAYNMGIVDDSASKIKQTVHDISGSQPRSLTDAGNDLISTVKDKYHAEKEALGPVFDQIKKSAAPLSASESQNLAVVLGERTKLGKVMTIDEATGKFKLGKNSPRTGISDQEHGILGRLIDDLNEGITFEEMQRSRDFLRKAIDPMNPGASDEINKVRSIMLEQMEIMAQRQGENVGKTFKAYAINERARENVEKVIGGKIESLDAMYSANPDKVVQKVFSNPNYAKVVGEYVGKEKMNEMVASYIQKGVDGAFDSAKGFQPHTLKGWIKKNDNFLRANVDPAVKERLEALADYGYYGRRFLDEVNPSGTAASFQAMLEPGGFVNSIKKQGIVGGIRSEVVNKVSTKVNQRQAVKSVNEMLGAEPKKSFRIADEIKDNFPVKKTSDGFAASLKSSALSKNYSDLERPILSADGKEEPKKGPDKWALDGAKKLIDSGIDQEIIDKIKSDKKGRQLLIEASDLSKGSKAMDSVIKRIRTGYLETKGAQ